MVLHRHRLLGLQFARVTRRLRFEEQDVDPALGRRLMLDAPGHAAAFSGIQPRDSIPEVQVQTPRYHQEKLVFLDVRVPDQLPFALGELDVLAIQLANQLWGPVLVEPW